MTMGRLALVVWCACAVASSRGLESEGMFASSDHTATELSKRLALFAARSHTLVLCVLQPLFARAGEKRAHSRGSSDVVVFSTVTLQNLTERRNKREKKNERRKNSDDALCVLCVRPATGRALPASGYHRAARRECSLHARHFVIARASVAQVDTAAVENIRLATQLLRQPRRGVRERERERESERDERAR